MPMYVVYACFGTWMATLTAVFYLVPQWSTVAWAAISLSGAAAVLVGIRRHRPARKLPWLLLAASLACFTAGDTIYNVLTGYLGQEDPFPSLADPLYVAVYPLLAGALLIMIRARSGGANRGALLDALLPTAAFGLLSWVLLIAPYVRDTELTLAEKLTSIAYPLGDVLALAMVLRLLTAAGRKPLSLTVLALGVSGLLATDVVYGMGQLAGTWQTGGPTDLGWVFFYATVGAAALHPSMIHLTPTTAVSLAVGGTGGRRILLLCLASLIGPAVLLVEDLEGVVMDARVVAAACAVMFLLVIARVNDLLGIQRAAGDRERALRRAGAKLVAAATGQEAADALRKAIAEIMPDDQSYRLCLVADEVTPDEIAARSDQGATIVPLSDVPRGVAGQLTGFEVALHATLVGAAGQAGGPVRRRHAYLAARPATLLTLQPSFEALFAQAAMALERIELTAEITRRSSEDYVRTLIRSASDVILVVNDDEVVRYASPAAADVFGWPDVVGASLAELIDGPDQPALRELLARSRAHGDHGGTVLTAVRADGASLQVECVCRDLRADPTVAGLVLTIRDVTERRRLESDLAYQAFYDGVTGLANRVLFQDRLDRAVLRAARDGSTIGVLFVDLDDFKEVNDTLGHAVGDRLLHAVGERIAHAIGPGNTAARMGGDEFGVLIENVHGPADADRLAARIVAGLADPIEVCDGRGGTHVVSGAASVGVTTNVGTSNATELLRQADLALHAAKAEGKNDWQRYESGMHAAMVQRLELRSALNEAAARGELVLKFQPIVDLPTEAIVGVEALVRWQHPTRGLLGPNEFIEHAEDNGAIVGIGRWVLCEALRALVGWRVGAPESAPRYVSVNVSARQFRTPGFVDDVRAALADTGARPAWLLLEITESLVLHDTEQVWADLRELRDLGVRIAIDDFGTGYSSLSYLRQLPVDVLKIDKSFIDEILSSDTQLALVEAIVGLARKLKLDVVAEGIEHPAHRRQLIQLGCPYGQGYLFSKPVNEADLPQLFVAPAPALPVVVHG